MIEAKISAIEKRFKCLFIRYFSGKLWDWKFASLLILMVWFWSFPSYQDFFLPVAPCKENWDDLQAQFLDPFTVHGLSADTHIAQARYRILLPLLFGSLGISPKILILIMPLFGVLFFRLLLSRISVLTGSKMVAALIAIGLAATYVGRAFTVDIVGYFDGIAYLFLLLALFSEQWVLVFVYCLGAFLVDERSIVVAPFVVLFGWIVQNKDSGIFASILLLRKPLLPIVGSLLVAFGVRFYLSLNCGFGSVFPDSELVGMSVIRFNYQILPLLWLSGIGFFWISTLLPAFYFYDRFPKAEAFVYLLFLAFVFFIFLTVLDVTRAAGYLFPAVLLGHILMFKEESSRTFRRYLVLLTGFTCLFPPLFCSGNTVYWQGPIIPKVFKIIQLWSQTQM